MIFDEIKGGKEVRLEKKAALDNAIPVRRVAEPAETARLVAWLASDKSSYVTATTYFSDGKIMQNRVGF